MKCRMSVTSNEPVTTPRLPGGTGSTSMGRHYELRQSPYSPTLDKILRSGSVTIEVNRAQVQPQVLSTVLQQESMQPPG